MVAFVASLVLNRGIAGEELQVHIVTADREYLFPLGEDRHLELEGPYGITRVAIQNSGVTVLDSPGRRKICVQQGRISRSGGWLICLPNQVFIKIIGSERTIDAHSY